MNTIGKEVVVLSELSERHAAGNQNAGVLGIAQFSFVSGIAQFSFVSGRAKSFVL